MSSLILVIIILSLIVCSSAINFIIVMSNFISNKNKEKMVIDSKKELWKDLTDAHKKAGAPVGGLSVPEGMLFKIIEDHFGVKKSNRRNFFE